MKISFICNHIYLNGGWSPWDIRLGGSEEFIVEVSKRLARKGHEVNVYHNGKHGTFEDVGYWDHDEYEPGDVTINVNYPQWPVNGPTIYWTSLTENPDLGDFKAVCYISEYARNNTGIKHENLFWVPPGYDETKIYPSKKIPKQCFYASSPDRGLETLLKAWPEVHETHPDATLLLTYGIERVDLPGVTCLGDVDENTMNEIYQTSDVWCHPASGGELYCLTGIKAQASGCVPVIIPTMALKETVRFGLKAELDDYAETLIMALNNPKLRNGIRNNLKKEKFPTWENTTKILLDIIKSVL